MSLDRKGNYTTQHGAHTLADSINSYWAKRGRAANAYVVQENLPTSAIPVYCVRSRMVGGRP